MCTNPIADNNNIVNEIVNGPNHIMAANQQEEIEDEVLPMDTSSDDDTSAEENGDSASGDDSSSRDDFDFSMLSYESNPDTPKLCVNVVEEQEHGIGPILILTIATIICALIYPPTSSHLCIEETVTSRSRSDHD
ncbi:hypothetical protein ACFE04_022298 [Oxalis oulophora]